MSAYTLPHLPKVACPSKRDCAGFLGTAFILAALFIWG